MASFSNRLFWLCLPFNYSPGTSSFWFCPIALQRYMSCRSCSYACRSVAVHGRAGWRSPVGVVFLGKQKGQGAQGGEAQLALFLRRKKLQLTSLACIVSFESNVLGTYPGHSLIVIGPAEAVVLFWQTDKNIVLGWTQ